MQSIKYIDYTDFKSIILSADKSFWQHDAGYKLLLPALDDFIDAK